MVWMHELKIVEMRICGVSRRPYLLFACATVDAARVVFTRSIYHLSVAIFTSSCRIDNSHYAVERIN